MNEIKIKSNGLRNELKEIRKSIDKLTNAILAQTNKHEEDYNYDIGDNNKLRSVETRKNS
tara:strand:+ start:940 stop:1119 length:180 start_codon:yes stop_codon:yes gene_type:complete